MSADERSRSVCAGSTLDATSGAFMFPAWRIQPVPDGFILLVLRNHLEDLIPPLALVQVQPPPCSERREAPLPHGRAEQARWLHAGYSQLWFLEPCWLVFHPVV